MITQLALVGVAGLLPGAWAALDVDVIDRLKASEHDVIDVGPDVREAAREPGEPCRS